MHPCKPSYYNNMLIAHVYQAINILHDTSNGSTTIGLTFLDTVAMSYSDSLVINYMIILKTYNK